MFRSGMSWFCSRMSVFWNVRVLKMSGFWIAHVPHSRMSDFRNTWVPEGRGSEMYGFWVPFRNVRITVPEFPGSGMSVFHSGMSWFYSRMTRFQNVWVPDCPCSLFQNVRFPKYLCSGGSGFCNFWVPGSRMFGFWNVEYACSNPIQTLSNFIMLIQ